MQCLLQVFDRDGSAQLSGGSHFKEHIGWLPLLAWSPHVTPHARDSAALRERSPPSATRASRSARRSMRTSHSKSRI